MSGTPDIPENYVDVTYALVQNNDITILTVTQEGVKTEESLKHSSENWKTVFTGLKKILEP